MRSLATPAGTTSARWRCAFGSQSQRLQHRLLVGPSAAAPLNTIGSPLICARHTFPPRVHHRRYSDALKHFAAAIDFEADGGRSERLRTGVQQYVERHRTLKGLLQQHSFDALVALEDTWEEVLTDTSLPPAFRLECEHAHQSLMQAQHHDKEQRYTRAFAMYERGLEVLAACLRDNKGVIPQKTADDVTTILMRGLDRAEDVKARLAHFAGPLSEAFSLGSRDAGTGGALAKDSRCTIS